MPHVMFVWRICAYGNAFCSEYCNASICDLISVSRIIAFKSNTVLSRLPLELNENLVHEDDGVEYRPDSQAIIPFAKLLHANGS